MGGMKPTGGARTGGERPPTAETTRPFPSVASDGYVAALIVEGSGIGSEVGAAAAPSVAGGSLIGSFGGAATTRSRGFVRASCGGWRAFGVWMTGGASALDVSLIGDAREGSGLRRVARPREDD
jgi:hypothetical protein